MPEQVKLEINGKPLHVPLGTSVGAAIILSGIDRFRTSVSGEPRGSFCGMGICFECKVKINGRPGIRSCQLRVREGMTVQTS